MQLLSFPPDVLRTIFDQVEPTAEAFRLSLVCKKFATAIRGWHPVYITLPAALNNPDLFLEFIKKSASRIEVIDAPRSWDWWWENRPHLPSLRLLVTAEEHRPKEEKLETTWLPQRSVIWRASRLDRFFRTSNENVVIEYRSLPESLRAFVMSMWLLHLIPVKFFLTPPPSSEGKGNIHHTVYHFWQRFCRAGHMPAWNVNSSRNKVTPSTFYLRKFFELELAIYFSTCRIRPVRTATGVIVRRLVKDDAPQLAAVIEETKYEAEFGDSLKRFMGDSRGRGGTRPKSSTDRLSKARFAMDLILSALSYASILHSKNVNTFLLEVEKLHEAKEGSPHNGFEEELLTEIARIGFAKACSRHNCVHIVGACVKRWRLESVSVVEMLSRWLKRGDIEASCIAALVQDGLKSSASEMPLVCNLACGSPLVATLIARRVHQLPRVEKLCCQLIRSTLSLPDQVGAFDEEYMLNALEQWSEPSFCALLRALCELPLLVPLLPPLAQRAVSLQKQQALYTIFQTTHFKPQLDATGNSLLHYTASLRFSSPKAQKANVVTADYLVNQQCFDTTLRNVNGKAPIDLIDPTDQAMRNALTPRPKKSRATKQSHIRRAERLLKVERDELLQRMVSMSDPFMSVLKASRFDQTVFEAYVDRLRKKYNYPKPEGV